MCQRGKCGGYWGRTSHEGGVPAQRAHSAGAAPNSQGSRDHPENHPPAGELRPRGKDSRFRLRTDSIVAFAVRNMVCFN